MLAKILLIDKDAELTSLIAFALEQAGYESCKVLDPSGAMQLLGLHSPDLVVLGLRVPQLDDLDACRELRRQTEAPIVVLGAQGGEDELVAAFDAGADDYLRKPFSVRVLVARIRSLLRRWNRAVPESMRAAHLRLDLSERTLKIGESAPIRLTPHEFTVVRLLMSTPGRTVTSQRMLMQLWGDAASGNQRMLKQLIYRLRQKVEQEPSNPRLLVTTPQAGYRLTVDGPDR